MRGVQCDGPLISLDGLIAFAAIPKDSSEIIAEVGPGWRQAYGLMSETRSFSKLPVPTQFDAQVTQSFRIIRHQLDRLSVMSDRLRPSAFTGQDDPKIVVGRSCIWKTFYLCLKSRRRFVPTIQCQQRITEIKPIIRRFWINLNCSINPLDSRFKLLVLRGDHTQKMPRVGMVRLNGKDLPIN